MAGRKKNESIVVVLEVPRRKGYTDQQKFKAALKSLSKYGITHANEECAFDTSDDETLLVFGDRVEVVMKNPEDVKLKVLRTKISATPAQLAEIAHHEP